MKKLRQIKTEGRTAETTDTDKRPHTTNESNDREKNKQQSKKCEHIK